MKTIEVDDIKDALPGDRIHARFVETGEEVTATAYCPDKRSEGWVYFLGWPLRKSNGTYGLGIKNFEAISITRDVPEPEYEPGTVYEIVTHDGDTMKAWCHTTLDPDAWPAEKCGVFVNRDGDEFLPRELASIDPVTARIPPTQDRIAKALFGTVTGSALAARVGAAAVLALLEEGDEG